MADVPFHPIAEVFPMLPLPALDALAEDIRQNGLRQPIVMFEGKILDGRNRYRACLAARVDARFREFGSDPGDGDDPVALVVSLNLRRRQLTESQAAIAAAKLANLSKGQNARYADRPVGLSAAHDESELVSPAVSQAEAAGMLNIGVRTVKRARRVVNQGAEGIVAMVQNNELTLRAAEEVITLPREEQEKLAAEGVEAVKARAKERKAQADRWDRTSRENAKARRNGKKPHHSKGKATPAEADMEDALAQVKELVRRWESYMGLTRVVRDWERSKRWTFCDELEALGKVLRKWSVDLRHMAGPTAR